MFRGQQTDDHIRQSTDEHSIDEVEDGQRKDRSNSVSENEHDQKLGGEDENSLANVPLVKQKQQRGISSIEAIHKMFGGNKEEGKKRHFIIYLIYLSLFAIIVATVLANSTVYSYQPIVSSLYQDHALLLGVIGTATRLISAISQPFIAKLCDVFSRQTGFLFVIACNVLGFLIVAASHTVGAYAVGSVIASIGQAGISLVTTILLADLSPLEWRAFALSLSSAPYIVFSFVGANIATSILNAGQWRWGYGMFCIIQPVCVLPIIYALYWAETKAQKANLVHYKTTIHDHDHQEDHQEDSQNHHHQIATVAKESVWKLFTGLVVDIDLIGLLLLGLAWSLILLPFSLEASAKDGWKNPSMIAMLVVGVVILVLFVGWEKFIAPMPLVNGNIAKNKVFILGAVLDFCFYLSGYLRDSYYPSYVYIVTNWTLSGWTYWNQIETVALCVFGVFYGILIRVTHRYKWLQISGTVLRTICVGLTLYASGSKATTAALVCIQLFLNIGAAASVVGTQVATQASVPHQDLAQVIAQLALWTQLGGAIGTSISAAIWTNEMPKNMAKAGIPANLIETLYDSITDIKENYAFNDPIRQEAIHAYDQTTKPMFIVATVFTGITVLCALFMPNYHLGKEQNKVEGTDIRGQEMGENEQEEVVQDQKKSTSARILHKLFG